MDLVVTAIVALIVGLTILEFQDCHPRLLAWIIHRASKMLPFPEEEQRRYEEEWLADIQTWPGRPTQLLRALGCVCGAAKAKSMVVVVQRSSKVSRFYERARFNYKASGNTRLIHEISSMIGEFVILFKAFGHIRSIHEILVVVGEFVIIFEALITEHKTTVIKLGLACWGLIILSVGIFI